MTEYISIRAIKQRRQILSININLLQQQYFMTFDRHKVINKILKAPVTCELTLNRYIVRAI